MVDLSPNAHRLQLAAGVLVVAVILMFLVVSPMYSRPTVSQLQNILDQGELRVITRNGATTYYEDDAGKHGFEYQLAKLFAESLGVKLRLIVADSYPEIYTELIYSAADLAAAGLSQQDDGDHDGIAYSNAYHIVTHQLIYKKNAHAKKPKNLRDLQDKVIEVVEGSSAVTLLESLKPDYPQLIWHTHEDKASEELIEKVNNGSIDFLLADSHEIALQRRFFPELRIAFELEDEKALRWATKQSNDTSLLDAVNEFIGEIKKNGILEQLIHRYYSHVEKFNYSDITTFQEHVKKRLPKFRPIFEKIAKQQQLEWTMLAAISYQESLWDPKAKSPTGVRGLMMLTQNTARLVKITNRLDPEQSILGGARYFKRVLQKIPERIPQPDHTWLALASYNIGFGHVEDARKITQGQKGDPDKWLDVKKYLPYLSRKQWYTKTKHGYARGGEPVIYVENIRKYYDLLNWMVDKEKQSEINLRNVPPTPAKLRISPSF